MDRPPEDSPLKISPRNWLWVGFAAVFLFSLLHQLPPAPQVPQPAGSTSTAAGRFSNIPCSGLGFQGRDIPLNTTENTVYREAAALKRSYQSGSHGFILTAVDGSRNRHAVHDPLYCIRGDGWQILHGQTITVPGGNARLLSLTRAGRRTEVLFWFSNGSTRHQSAWRAWWLSLTRRISFGMTGSDPTLVFLQPATDQAPDWQSVFARCPFLFDI